MSSFGSGYTVLSSILSPSSPFSPSSCLDYLRSNSLGGLKYSPDDSRTLSLDDVYHYCRSISLTLRIVRYVSPSDSSRVLALAPTAVLHNPTCEWIAIPPTSLTASSLPTFLASFQASLPPLPSSALNTGASDEDSDSSEPTFTFVALAPSPPPPSSSLLANYNTAACTCDITIASQLSSSHLQSASFTGNADLCPTSFVYGDITFNGTHSLHRHLLEYTSTHLFVDLGSGSGLYLYALSLLAVPPSSLIGFELVPTLAELSRKILPLSVPVVEADFLDESTDWARSEAPDAPQVVFCHCTVVFPPAEMKRLRQKLEQTCPASSLFVAVGSPLPDLDIVEEVLIEVSWGVEVAVIQRIN